MQLWFMKNVAFHKTNEIGHIQSQLISTFVIETQLCSNLLKRLSEDLRKAEIAANKMEKSYEFLQNKSIIE